MQRRSMFWKVFRRLAIVLVAQSGSVLAQAISGKVVLPDRVTPLSGAIIVATDNEGKSSRALSSDSGNFLVRLPHAGRFLLRILRIGFRPTTGQVIDVGLDATASITLVASSEAISLSAVSVRASETCRVNPDSGLLVARVWAEARKALMASQLGTAGQQPLDASWIEYERLLDASGRRIRQQSVRLANHPTTHAFKSRPAQVFVTKGYVFEESGTTMFFAPDPDVLLSDEFAATHCFRLGRDGSAGRDLVGVAFEPTRDRDSMRDIEGTIWVDRQSSELKSLEFRYTNLPEQSRGAGAGGHVGFRRIDGGSWLVQEWELRFPILEKPDATRDAGTRRLVYSATSLDVTGVQTTGGEVTQLRRGDSTLFKGTRANLAIKLVGRDSLISTAGASVSIDGTDYVAKTDSTGIAQFGAVVPGTYLARVRVPLLDLFDQPPIDHDVRVTDGAAVDSIVLPNAEAILARICPKDALRNGEGMLYGSVANDLGSPAADATVTATWKRLTKSETVDRTPGVTDHSSRSVANNRGQWHICGIPRGVALTLRASAVSGSGMQHTRIPEQHAWETVALSTRAGTASTTEPGARTILELSVMNAAGVAIPAVGLTVREDQAVTHEISTDADGHAVMADMHPGRITVDARRIGFKPGSITFSVLEGNNTAPIVLSEIAMPTLDTVRVVGGRVIKGRNGDFEARRMHQDATASFTRADIEKRNPADAWQMLTNLPSVRVIQNGGKTTVESTRGFVLVTVFVILAGGLVLANGKLVPCYLTVMVDGTPLNPNGGDVRLEQLPRPAEIYGIELFAGPARIPPEYSVEGRCGLVAIWTR